MHGGCKSSAEDIINAAKTSVGIDSNALSFQLIHLIKRLKSLNDEINEYGEIKSSLQFYNNHLNYLYLSYVHSSSTL